MGTITDDDALPTLSIDDVTQAEGTTLSFTVSLSSASEKNVTFDWTSSDTTALAGTDYTAGSASSVTILAGSTTSTINIATTNDTIYEVTETMAITLSSPGNATIADANGVGTITDNETLPTLSIDDVTITEGGTASFTVTLSAISGEATTFDWATSNNTAIAGTDYTAGSASTVTIPAGSTTTTINIITADDTLDEAVETFDVVLSNPASATIADNTGVATLNDNDVAPTVSVDDVAVTEAGTATFT